MSTTVLTQTPDGGTRKKIAHETLKAIEIGSYTIANSPVPIELEETVKNSKAHTLYYAHDSTLSSWAQSQPEEIRTKAEPTKIWAVETSTLETARSLVVDKLSSQMDSTKEGKRSPAQVVGVLNFASAKSPGGGFLGGSRAQEETIARSSTLYPSLMTPIAQQYYAHNREITKSHNDGYYSHGMIYSPFVLVIRNEAGDWIPPYEVDILTSPAVNAGVVRAKRRPALARGQDVDSVSDIEMNIRTVMKERMARVLYLFELRGVRTLVLGSFGTGAFKNDVDMVVELWAELLSGENARFRRSFDRVVFGVIGHATYMKFAERFGTEVA